MLMGTFGAIRDYGLRVPEDIMIAAVGDNRIGRVAYVPLTSAHLHYRTAGDKAARLLLDMLADPHAEPQMIKLDYELKCRASTGMTTQMKMSGRYNRHPLRHTSLHHCGEVFVLCTLSMQSPVFVHFTKERCETV